MGFSRGFPDSSVGKKIYLQCRRPQFNSWTRKICWRRDTLLTPVFLGFPCGSAGKESACNAGDLGSIPGFGRSPGEGKGYPLQYPGLENPMDYIVHGVTKSRTGLSDFHFYFRIIYLDFLLLSRIVEIMSSAVKVLGFKFRLRVFTVC